MSWVKVYLHLVFATKNRTPFLDTEKLRKTVFQHIGDNCKEKGIWLDCVNGYKDHTHCLISLGKEQTISKVTQLIKGESSFWINKYGLTKEPFAWQDDYWAVSVSESHINKTRIYIYNQEAHNSTKSFKEEVDVFMEKFGWALIKDEK